MGAGHYRSNADRISKVAQRVSFMIGNAALFITRRFRASYRRFFSARPTSGFRPIQT
jgi:hypothetical protein